MTGTESSLKCYEQWRPIKKVLKQLVFCRHHQTDVMKSTCESSSGTWRGHTEFTLLHNWCIVGNVVVTGHRCSVSTGDVNIGLRLWLDFTVSPAAVNQQQIQQMQEPEEDVCPLHLHQETSIKFPADKLSLFLCRIIREKWKKRSSSSYLFVLLRLSSSSSAQCLWKTTHYRIWGVLMSGEISFWLCLS